MSDLFLDALSVKPAPSNMELMRDAARSIHKQAAALQQPPRKPIQVVGPLYKPGTRPSFADDIDRIVAEMVASGDVYLDADVYKARKRSWRMVQS